MMGKSEGDQRTWLSRIAYAALIGALACNAGALAGCSGSSGGGGGGGEEDAGDAGDSGHVDSGGDAGHDGGADAGDSGTVDSGADTGTVDSGADTGTVDSGEDSGHDAGDSGTNTTTDAGDGGGHDAGDSGTNTTTDAGDGGGHDAGDSGTTTDAGDAGGGSDAGDAGGPTASFAATPILLGNGDCGGAAVTGSLSITNTGGSPLTVAASFGSSTGFSVTSTIPTAGIAANGSGTLNLSATVPGTATVGTDLVGTLTITTNDPSHASTQVTVKVTPHGATLAFAPNTATSAAYNVVPENVAATPITLSLVNNGNADATGVTFGAPAATDFTITAPTAATTITANGGTLAVATAFTPTSTTAQNNVTSAITVGAGVPICGTSLTSISLSGQGGVGAVTGWPANTIAFGPASCGTTPGQQSVVLTNGGGIPVHITGVTFGGATTGYTTDLVANTSVVPANGSLTFHINGPAIPTTSAVPGNFGATLTVTTDQSAGDSHTIDLNEAAQGAIITTDVGGGGLTFDPVAAFGSANLGFHVINGGSAANVTLTPTLVQAPDGVTADPFTTSPLTFTLQPGGAATQQSVSESFAPTTFGTFKDSIQVSVAPGTILCAPLPANVTVTGTGQSGGISLNSTNFTFSANCGATAPPQTLTIRNDGNEPIQWTGQQLSPPQTVYNTSQTLSPDGTIGDVALSDNTLLPGEQDTITITPVAIPQFPQNTSPTAFTSEIDITTNIQNDVIHHIFLSETPLGDILSIVPSSGSLTIPNQSINVNNANATSFSIVNNANPGTPPASISLTSEETSTLAEGDTASFPVQGSATVNLGASVQIPVGFDAPAHVPPGDVESEPPTPPAIVNGVVSLTTTDAVCSPPPTEVDISATVTDTNVAVDTTQLVFTNNVANDASEENGIGLVECGKIPQAQTVTVTNTGNQDATIAGVTIIKGQSADGTASSPYYVASPTTGVLTANGGSIPITVSVPNGIPATEPNHQVPDDDEFFGVMQISVTAASLQPQTLTVNLIMGAMGVIITTTPPASPIAISSSFGVPTQDKFRVTNTGNWGVASSLLGIPPGQGDTPPDFTIEAAAGSTLIDNGTFAVQNTLASSGADSTPGTAVPVVIQFNPETAGTVTDNGFIVLTPAPGDVQNPLTTMGSMCAPLPAGWANITAGNQGATDYVFQGTATEIP